MDLLAKYHLWIMIAGVVGLTLLPSEHKKKKSVLTLIIVLSFSVGYELILGEPVTKMPERINNYFNQDGASQTENLRYHDKPEERVEKRYGDPVDLDN